VKRYVSTGHHENDGWWGELGGIGEKECGRKGNAVAGILHDALHSLKWEVETEERRKGREGSKEVRKAKCGK
jgi:hypothetical protein